MDQRTVRLLDKDCECLLVQKHLRAGPGILSGGDRTIYLEKSFRTTHARVASNDSCVSVAIKRMLLSVAGSRTKYPVKRSRNHVVSENV